MNRVWPAVLLFAVSVLLVVSAAIYNRAEQKDVDEKVCQSTVENRDAVRSTWVVAQNLILQGQTSSIKRERTRKFFDTILVQIPPLECVDRRPVERKEN